MAGVHQLKKLAQSRNGGSRCLDYVPRHWSVYTLVFSTLSLLLFCLLFFDIGTSPNSLLLHATRELGILRAQVGESYLFSPSRSSPEEVITGADNSLPVESAGNSKESKKGILTNKEKPEVSSLDEPAKSSVDDDLLQQEEKIDKKVGQRTTKDAVVIEGKQSEQEIILTEEKRTDEESIALDSPGEGKIKEVSNETETKGVLEISESSESVDVLQELRSDSGACDFSKGKWVYDESYPLYKPNECPFVDGGFRCVENGRPSDEFQKWRWQPSGCNLPRFDAKKILERLRGSRMAFVGDSIGRNNWESMLCMLADGVSNKSRIYEINGETISKHTGFLSFRFEDYDCTVEYYRSPYLVPQGRAPQGSDPKVKTTLKLDQIDWTASKWKDASIVIFNSGHWWSYGKTVRSGNYFQVGKKVPMDMEVGEAFATAMKTVARFVDREMDPKKTQVFFRSYAPVHFKGGTWDNGGTCNGDTKPLTKFPFIYEDKTCNNMISEVMSANKKNHVNFVNITYLSDLRPDGHSSIWQRVPPSPKNRQDCSHWCLPGVPDTWNELLYATLLTKGQGSWRETAD